MKGMIPLYETLKIERYDWGIALILNRPEKLNALSPTLVSELHEALDKLRDEQPNLLLIKGAGTSFCSGHDISTLTNNQDDGEAEKGVLQLQEITERIVHFPAPVIAAVTGYALGAGCEIALNCDLIYASEEAIFGFPELKVGLSITQGSSYFLPRLVGLPKAKELLFFSENIMAKEALDAGLLNDVFSRESFDTEIEKKLATLGKVSAPALRAIKNLFNEGAQSSLADSLQLEVLELKKLIN